MNLTATDTGRKTAHVETYSFNVQNPPEFNPVPDKGWAPPPGCHNFTADGAPYVNESYTLCTPHLDTSATTVSQGSPSNVTFVLGAGAPNEFYVKSDTGRIYGKVTEPGRAAFALLAVDPGGKRRVYQNYTFTAMTRPRFMVSDQWKPDSLTTGYLSAYTVNQTYELAEPNLVREDLFVNYANQDASKITFIMEFESLQTPGAAAASSTNGGAAESSPGKFLVGNSGEALARPSRLGKYTGRLRARDAAGATIDVKTWDFAVVAAPNFAVVATLPRNTATGSTDDLADYDDSSTTYHPGTAYMIAPKHIDASLTTFTAGTADDVTYRLEQSAATDFFVNSDNGAVFGKFPLNMDQVVNMTLLVIDKAGVTGVLEEYTFRVAPVPQFGVSDQWKPESLAADEGYLSEYTVNQTYELAEPNLVREDLFVNYANQDASKTTFIMEFESLQTPGAASASSTNGGAAESSPGKFLVGNSGEALARPSRLGKYTGRLRARDAAGATIDVKTWVFEVLRADVEFDEYGPNKRGCANGGRPLDTVELDRKFTCDCGGTQHDGANCGVRKTVQTYPMAISPDWNEDSLGPESKYAPKYSWRDSFELSAPNLTAQQLFVNYTGGDASAITYSLVVRGTNTTSANSTPGKFFVSSTGATLAKMAESESSLGSYTGQLRATDGAGEYVQVKSWVFEVLKEDMDVDGNGPNGRPCSNNSKPVDGKKLDQMFTCICNDGYSGENCGTAPETTSSDPSAGAASSSTEVYVVSAVFTFLLLALATAVIIIRVRAAAERNKPYDFDEEFNKLLDAGLIVSEEDFAAAQAEKNLPQEIKRKYVSLTDKLGNGAFGEVWKGVYDEPGGGAEYLVAVKTLLKETDESTKEMVQEAVVMAHIGSHKHVVSLIGAVTAGTPKLLVMNFCEHGSLQDYLKKRAAATPFTEAERLKAAHDVALGMTHLESKRVVHRDLAARNVLVDSLFRCKVADFGLSRAAGTSDDKDGAEEVYYRANQGTFPVRWTAPEAMETMLFNIPTDVWSYGVLLLEIYLDGGRPYPGMDNQTVISRVASGYRAFRPEGCSFAVYTDVILPCWDKDPAARPSFVELAVKLEQLTADVAHAPAPAQTKTQKSRGFDNAHYNGGTSPGGDGHIVVGAGDANDDGDAADDGAIEDYGVRVSVAEAMKRSGFQRQVSVSDPRKLYGEKRKPDVITEYVQGSCSSG